MDYLTPATKWISLHPLGTLVALVILVVWLVGIYIGRQGWYKRMSGSSEASGTKTTTSKFASGPEDDPVAAKEIDQLIDTINA